MEEINETTSETTGTPGESAAEAAATAPLPEAPAASAAAAPEAPTGIAEDAGAGRGHRAEKVGVVTSDKMSKTVTVRVDRLVKHPIYKRYVKRRSKFMAHNEVEGVTTGDMVRIVETRPLSARKRWRVVEVVRKASK